LPRRFRWRADISRKKERPHETDCASGCGDGRAFGLRDDAEAARDADLRGWIANSSRSALPAASAATSASAAAADGLPGRNDGLGRHGLPAAATASADTEAVWRTRLIAQRGL
jgi:hypothetical protein